MKYKAEDGTVLESKAGKAVTYSCATSFADGIYETEETQGAGTELGIRQIKIKRVVNDGVCDYTVTEATESELLAYKEKAALVIEQPSNNNE